MPEPTGQQWMRLYRGLSDVTPREVLRNPIGPHWTPDPRIAQEFATNEASTWGDWPEEEHPLHGTIVEALVHRRHVISPGSPEWEEFAGLGDIFDRDHPEREHTLRPGATIHIQKMHFVHENPKEWYTVDMPRSLRSRGRA